MVATLLSLSGQPQAARASLLLRMMRGGCAYFIDAGDDEVQTRNQVWKLGLTFDMLAPAREGRDEVFKLWKVEDLASHLGAIPRTDDTNAPSAYNSPGWQAVEEAGYCDFCIRTHEQVLVVKSQRPGRRLTVQVCPHCFSELQAGASF